MQVPVFFSVQVFQKYSPGLRSTPSGGFSLTREALAQFGSGGAEERVAAAVGVTAIAAGVSTGSVARGVLLGRIATSVSDWPAWTVWATAVEIVASCSPEDPHADTKSINTASIASTQFFRSSDIQIPFLCVKSAMAQDLIIPFRP